MKQTPIGLDIGSAHISVAQLARVGRQWRVRCSLRFERGRPGEAPGLDEARRTLDVLERQGLAGGEVVLALPLARQISGVLELPARAGGAPVDMLARDELARMHKQDAGKLRSALWELPAPGRSALAGGRSETAPVMAVGCTLADAEAFIRPLARAGFGVVALDARCQALARGAGLLHAGHGHDLALVLDLEADASLLVVTVDGLVVYERVLPEASMEALSRRMGERFGLDPAMTTHVLETVGLGDADYAVGGGGLAHLGDIRALLTEFVGDIAREVSVSMGYAAQRFPQVAGEDIQPRLIVSGAGGRIPGLGRRLGERALLASVPAPGGIDAGVMVAVGLAQHGREFAGDAGLLPQVTEAAA